MATTLSSLKTRIRQRIDKENSTYLSDAELLSYINASYAELYDQLVEAYEDYFVADPVAFSLTSGDSGVYALPATFYKLKGIDYRSGGEWVAIKPYNWNERNVRNRSYNRIAGGALEKAYRMIGGNLRIEPDDDAVGDYQLWFVPSYTPLASDTDEVDSTITRNNWEEFIVIDVGIKILAKEESDTRQLTFEKQQIVRRIENMAGDRDVDQPETITDSRYGDDDGDWRRF